MDAMETPWHSLPVSEVVKVLGTDLVYGLARDEVLRRLSLYGLNEIAVKRRSPILMFLRQFTSFLVLILLAATAISAALGEVIDALAIALIVLMMGTFGFVQEYRSEKTLEALRKLATPYCRVIRDGTELEIPVTELVPGDIVLVREGDRVPADIRLTEADELEVNESSLTGESTPVEKDPNSVLDPTVPVAERVNMLFMGTYVVRGRGRGIVVATGVKTELGRIAKAVAEAKEEKSPLELELDYFGRRVGLIVIAIAAVVFITSIIEGWAGLLESFMVSVALAVAAIPEGLPAIATAVLAIGAYRMSKKRALVRRLSAVETLGAVDVICADKTGTITKGEMTVKVVRLSSTECLVEGVGYTPTGRIGCRDSVDISQLLKMLASHTSTDVKLVREGSEWVIKGPPTEGAALVLAYKGLSEEGVRRALEELPIVKVYPFDRFRKRKTTIHRYGDKYLAIVTGAPEILLQLSKYVHRDGSAVELDGTTRYSIARGIEELASQGYRTLGIAYRILDSFSSDLEVDEVERDLTFYAVLGIIDPPREGITEAIALARKAGVKTIMITGDHKLTAMAVAKMIGLDVNRGLALEGVDLDKMSDKDLVEVVDKVVVYARVTPEHKARIVRALKAKGYRVAMTGDGVNDAPALKEAHIGIAMGIRGTDVAKEASQLVLLDDNYVTIVEAIKEGRTIFENLKKPINYLLSANMGEVATIFGSQLLLMPPPLEPIHLLWINVVTDALPAAALGVEPPEPGLMDRPPRAPNERFINRRKLVYYIVMGSLIGITALAIFRTYFTHSVALARTAAFTAIVLTEFGRALSSRSENISFWKLPMNKWLLPALLASLGLQLLTIYTPLSTVFKTMPLPLDVWPLIALAPLVVLLADELRKLLGIRIS